jgi:hypothetical protein
LKYPPNQSLTNEEEMPPREERWEDQYKKYDEEF